MSTARRVRLVIDAIGLAAAGLVWWALADVWGWLAVIIAGVVFLGCAILGQFMFSRIASSEEYRVDYEEQRRDMA
jgi:fatty acid desaturase